MFFKKMTLLTTFVHIFGSINIFRYRIYRNIFKYRAHKHIVSCLLRRNAFGLLTSACVTLKHWCFFSL